MQFRKKSVSSEGTCSAERLRWERAQSVPGNWTELEQEVRGKSKEIKAE